MKIFLKTERFDRIILIAPSIVLLLVIIIFPLIWSLYLSFFKYNSLQPQNPVFVGLKNYYNILTNPVTWDRFKITIHFVALAVSVQFIIGLSLALLINREFKGRTLVMVLLLTPMMVCPAVVGLFWRYIFSPNWGILDYLLTMLFNIPPICWLSSPETALYAIVIVDTWIWTPFMLLISLAGLTAVPRHLYEVAQIDGASRWDMFRKITFPIIFPLLIIGLLFRTIDAFKIFDLIFVLTMGGPGTSTETLSMYLYRIAFRNFDTGYSCAFSYIFLIIMVLLSNAYIKILEKVQS